MATVRKQISPDASAITPSFQPDYPDEVSDEQLNVIRRIAGTATEEQSPRTLLYTAAW